MTPRFSITQDGADGVLELLEDELIVHVGYRVWAAAYPSVKQVWFDDATDSLTLHWAGTLRLQFTADHSTVLAILDYLDRHCSQMSISSPPSGTELATARDRNAGTPPNASDGTAGTPPTRTKWRWLLVATAIVIALAATLAYKSSTGSRGTGSVDTTSQDAQTRDKLAVAQDQPAPDECSRNVTGVALEMLTLQQSSPAAADELAAGMYADCPSRAAAVLDALKSMANSP